MRFIDLKSKSFQSHTCASSRKEMADEFGKDSVFSTDGLFAVIRVSPLCGSLPWPLQGEKFLLLGSVSVFGLCSAHLSRKPQGHRDLSSRGRETLPHGDSRQSLPQHPGARQRGARLENLSRLCPDADPKSQRTLPRRTSWCTTRSNPLCFRFHRYRSVPVAVSLGEFRKHKAAVKLHTLLDLRASIPTTVIITPGSVYDVNIMDELFWESGAIYVMDRGYLDFSRLHRIHQDSAFFVTRAKRNSRFQRLYSHRVRKASGLRCDQTVVLQGFYAHKDYPDKLRRIRYFDRQTNKALVFLTNNFTLPALTIAQLYRCRWQVELFFKWIKQHLRIKAFYGTSENAVKTQIWIAISVYVLVAIVRKRLDLHSLYSVLQFLSINNLGENSNLTSTFATR